MYSIQESTANDVWSRARVLLEQPEVTKKVDGRGGATREVLHVICTIRQPRERWIIARLPPINPAFAIAELVWIVTGRDDSTFLNRWNSRLPTFAGTGLKYDGAYGARLRKHFGIDQISRVCDALSSDSLNRQSVLQIWDPSIDLPSPDGSPTSTDIPCNICSLLKVRGGRLEWTQVLRSNDLFLGLPYNFIQFTYLQEILAGCLEIEVGEYCHLADSLHIYERDLSQFQRVSTDRPVANTDRLNASLTDTDHYFRELAAGIEALALGSPKSYFRVAINVQVPETYRNLLLIVAAERARRLRLRSDVEECLAACTNPSLTQIFGLWDRSRPATTG